MLAKLNWVSAGFKPHISLVTLVISLRYQTYFAYSILFPVAAYRLVAPYLRLAIKVPAFGNLVGNFTHLGEGKVKKFCVEQKVENAPIRDGKKGRNAGFFYYFMRHSYTLITCVSIPPPYFAVAHETRHDLN